MSNYNNAYVRTSRGETVLIPDVAENEVDMGHLTLFDEEGLVAFIAAPGKWDHVQIVHNEDLAIAEEVKDEANG